MEKEKQKGIIGNINFRVCELTIRINKKELKELRGKYNEQN